MTTQWVPPEPDEVALVVGSLADDNLRRLFFSELENPTWIAPLTDLRVFVGEPDVWVDETGAMRARSWPEGEYLARMAEFEPAAVAILLKAHAKSENPWVHRVALDAALVMPADEAAGLVPQITRALRLGYDWVDAARIVSLAEKLASTHPRQMQRLLTAAFEPKAAPGEADVLGTRSRVGSSIDAYWFGALAPRVVPLLVKLGLKGLKVVTGWLVRATDSLSGSKPSLKFRTSLWRPSIAPSSQNTRLNDVTEALIDITRDVAAEMATTSLNEVVDFLRGQDRYLLGRIALESAATAVAATPSHENLETAIVLLNDPSLMGLDARPEYVHLALVTMPHLSAVEVAQWQAIVDAAEWQGTEDEVRRIAAYAKPAREDVTDEDIAAVRRLGRYRFLLPLGDVLSVALMTELNEMKAEFGEIPHPEFGSYITTSFVGPVSPLDNVALAEMSADELRYFLASWEPTGDRRFGPSREGLAGELEKVATEKPEIVAAIAEYLIHIGPLYVRAAVSGWAKAIGNGFKPPEQVWALLVELVNLVDTDEEHPSEVASDDSVWGWAQRGACDFANSYLNSVGEGLTVADAARLWAVLAPLTVHADPTSEHEDSFGGDNMDPLTLSLNTTRPEAIRASIKLLRTIASKAVEFGTLRAEILEMLSHHVGVNNDPSLAVAAVIGEALGHLWDVDRTWIETRYDALFAVLSDDDRTRAWSDVVISVALRIYRTGRVFLDLMRPVMLEMLSRQYAERNHVDGWRGDRPALEAAANHIVTAYVTELINDDDPLMLALTSADASPTVIGDALGTLGWSIMRSRDAAADEPEGKSAAVPATVLERARGLIDRRVSAIQAGLADPAELTGFYWWILADVFSPSWSLPILLLANSNPDFDPKGMLGEPLARAAETEPALAIEVFESLMPGDGDGWKRYDLLQHAPRILAAALLSGEPNARSSARSILDRLGREGHMTLLSDVDRLTGHKDDDP